MEIKSGSFYKSKQFWTGFFVLLFVYVILFEFILPVNKILPKPSILWESFIALWVDYFLFYPLLYTLSVIYLSIVIGYVAVSFLSSLLIKLAAEYPGIFYYARLFKYFPAFFFVLLFTYWFNGSIIAEHFFGGILAFVFYSIAIYNQLPSVKEEFLLAAKGLKLPTNKIYSKVIWKSVQPGVMKSGLRLHYYLWVIILIYEFVSSTGGVGTIYSFILTYKDFAGLFSLALFLSLLIFTLNSLLKFIQNKLIFWES